MKAVCPPDGGCGDPAKVAILEQSFQLNEQFHKALQRYDYAEALAVEVNHL